MDLAPVQNIPTATPTYSNSTPTGVLKNQSKIFAGILDIAQVQAGLG